MIKEHFVMKERKTCKLIQKINKVNNLSKSIEYWYIKLENYSLLL